jgi:RIO kinase 2
MVENVAALVAELEDEDVHLLSGLEQGMRFSEWVDRDTLPEFARLTAEEVDHRLERCAERGLIERQTIQYEGYRLTFEGYDVLALHTFAERETIDAVGSPLGVGKESDVYEVRSYTPLACKFHREGYTNFRSVDREREYTADHDHVSWFYTARKAAEREYETLEDLYPDVSVPRPVDQNRHAIVMERVAGVELDRTSLDDREVLPILDSIFRELQRAYEAGYVHADMSEYNVFVCEDGVCVFDWPQAVDTDHENAPALFERDVENVLGYFHRKHPGVTPDSNPETVAERLRAGSFRSIEQLA